MCALKLTLRRRPSQPPTVYTAPVAAARIRRFMPPLAPNAASERVTGAIVSFERIVQSWDATPTASNVQRMVRDAAATRQRTTMRGSDRPAPSERARKVLALPGLRCPEEGLIAAPDGLPAIRIGVGDRGAPRQRVRTYTVAFKSASLSMTCHVATFAAKRLAELAASLCPVRGANPPS